MNFLTCWHVEIQLFVTGITGELTDSVIVGVPFIFGSVIYSGSVIYVAQSHKKDILSVTLHLPWSQWQLTAHSLRDRKKKNFHWEDCSCSKRKGSKSNLIVTQVKMVGDVLLLQKTSQTFEKYARFPIYIWGYKHATVNLHWNLPVYII